MHVFVCMDRYVGETLDYFINDIPLSTGKYLRLQLLSVEVPSFCLAVQKAKTEERRRD